MRNLKTRIIELSVNNRAEVIELPVNPPEVEFTEKQLNQTITLLNIGEANLKGERGLKYTKFSGFFPAERSPHYRYAKKAPKQYIAMLEEWKTAGMIVRVIITDMDINLAMLIDELDYSMKEGDDDIGYTLSFSEYRTLNVPSVNLIPRVRSNGLMDRCGRLRKRITGAAPSMGRSTAQTAEPLRRRRRNTENQVPAADTGSIRGRC